jgi:hypothetical protein
MACFGYRMLRWDVLAAYIYRERELRDDVYTPRQSVWQQGVDVPLTWDAGGGG